MAGHFAAGASQVMSLFLKTAYKFYYFFRYLSGFFY